MINTNVCIFVSNQLRLLTLKYIPYHYILFSVYMIYHVILEGFALYSL